MNRAVDEIYALAVAGPIPAETFLAAVRSRYPEEIGDPTLSRNLVYMLQTSSSDVSEFAAWLVWHLSRNPIWLARVRAADGDERVQLGRRIVMEAMRMGQSEYLLRFASRTFTWRGFTIPEATRIRVCIWESHQDPKHFEQPDAFNPDRWLAASPTHDRYSPFGAIGDRRCLGEGVTFTVARLLVEELACGFDVRVVRDAPVEYSGVHWRPGTRYRVALSSHTGVGQTH